MLHYSPNQEKLASALKNFSDAKKACDSSDSFAFDSLRISISDLVHSLYCGELADMLCNIVDRMMTISFYNGGFDVLPDSIAYVKDELLPLVLAGFESSTEDSSLIYNYQ